MWISFIARWCKSPMSHLLLLATFCVAASAFSPSWQYQGYDRFPSLFFGAQNGTNVTMKALEPLKNLEWITKHQLAGYGYQHAIGLMQEENALHTVAKQTKQYAQSKGRECATFVYRDSMGLDKEYVLEAALLNNTKYDHWFLQQNGTICTRPGQWPKSRQFNWSVAAARDWYIDTVIGEVANEDGVDMVFFDETDWTFHRYPWQAFTNCPNLGQTTFPTETDWAAYREAKADLLSRIVVKLNAAGKVPLFSCSGGTTANSLPKCPNQAFEWAEEDYVRRIRNMSAGGVYHRYYESWMGFGETDPDCWLNWLQNAIWETRQGLPFTVRWDMGMFNGSQAWLEFGMASFLMVQGDYCYFGAAANWYDKDWSYHPQYDWQPGKPLAPAVQSSKYAWYREFENCTVEVDLETRASNFKWRS